MTEVEPEEAKELADEILSRTQYQEAQPSLAQRAFEWVLEQLGELFRNVFGSAGGFWFGYLILAVAAAGAIFLVWRFMPRHRLSVRRTEAVVQRETSVARTRQNWLDEAEAAEAAGQWDRAVHARYHALTAGLADHEKLSPETSTTSGEHRSAFGRSSGEDPRRVERFNDATDHYEQVWFGGVPAGEPEARQLESVDDELVP